MTEPADRSLTDKSAQRTRAKESRWRRMYGARWSDLEDEARATAEIDRMLARLERPHEGRA